MANGPETPGLNEAAPVKPAEAPNVNDALESAFYKAAVKDKVKGAEQNPTQAVKEEIMNSWGKLQDVQRFIRAVKPGEMVFADEHAPGGTKNPTLNKITAALADIGELTQGAKPTGGGDRYVYLRQAKAKDGPIEGASIVGVNVKQAQADVQFLMLLKGVYPNSATQIDSLICLLQKLQTVDPAALASANYATMRANSATNRTFGYMGRLAGTAFFGGAAIVTGVMAAINKQWSVAPAIYGFGAYMSAVPGAMDNFFGNSPDKKLFTEAATVLQNKYYIALANEYSMGGPLWEGAITKIMKMDDQSTSPLKKYIRNEIKAEELAAALIEDTSSAEYGDLLRLINDTKKFNTLLGLLKDVKSTDAARLIGDYTRVKAYRFAPVDPRLMGKNPRPSTEWLNSVPTKPDSGEGPAL